MPSSFVLADRPSAERWTPRVVAPRHPSPADRRRDICRVGAALFAAEGVDALTITRLVGACGIDHHAFVRIYPSVAAVLEAVLNDFVADLNTDVGAAHDAAHAPDADPAPERRLEAVVAGFIEAATRHADAHRAFLVCVHRVAETERGTLLLRYQVVLESVRDLLAAAVPALAENAEASDTLLGTIHTLLSDPWRWRSPRGPRERQAEARRVAGLLLAAAIAETTGVWPALGTIAGNRTGLKSLTIGVRTARARFSEMLKAAEFGMDITLTRHGKRVARMVG